MTEYKFGLDLAEEYFKGMVSELLTDEGKAIALAIARATSRIKDAPMEDLTKIIESAEVAVRERKSKEAEQLYTKVLKGLEKIGRFDYATKVAAEAGMLDKASLYGTISTLLR